MIKLENFKNIQTGTIENIPQHKVKNIDVIKCEHLTKYFMGIKAVDDLSVVIPYTMTTGLIGPNGSGKTTLMNLLSGMLKPDSGTIQIKEQKYNFLRPWKIRKLRLARTFQDGRLLVQLSVVDNLLLPVTQNHLFKSLFEIKKTHYQEKLEEVLKITSLKEHQHKKAEELSYGLRKLLEIGRLLMQDADIYFFDEPFTGLFPEIVEKVCAIIEDLQKQSKTVVIIEHNMTLIKRLCDHIIVLDHGSLMAEGRPDDVLNNQKVREAYLGV